MNASIMSATQVKVRFGTILSQVRGGNPVVIEKNNKPAVVMMSVDDYEDFLEVKDKNFQNKLAKGYKEIKAGNGGSLDALYDIH